MLLGFLLAEGNGAGQLEPPRIEEMTVDLWPEYDRPATLVMYRFRVASGASPNAPVVVPIPPSVGEPHAVAWRNEEGALFVADYTRELDGDRALIVARLGSREGQLEFYGDLTFGGTARSFRFTWPGGVHVGSLSFQVQQPAGASGLRIVPEPTRRTVGQDGLTYALIELGEQSATSTPEVEFRYRKDSPALTDGPPLGDTPPPSAPSESGPWLFVLGGLLVGAGASWLAWSYLGTQSARGKATGTGVGVGRRAAFCHECGAKAQESASFCIHCGARLVTKET